MSTIGGKDLFLKEVSRQKLQRLAELAHKDPSPLLDAAKVGYFRRIKKEAIEILENEKKKAKYNNTKDYFQNIIQILSSNN